MKVRTILDTKGRHVVTIRPDASVSTAVHRLVLERIGALVVSEDGHKVAGIISERDIIQSLEKKGKSGRKDESRNQLWPRAGPICSRAAGVWPS